MSFTLFVARYNVVNLVNFSTVLISSILLLDMFNAFKTTIFSIAFMSLILFLLTFKYSNVVTSFIGVKSSILFPDTFISVNLAVVFLFFRFCSHSSNGCKLLILLFAKLILFINLKFVMTSAVSNWLSDKFNCSILGKSLSKFILLIESSLLISFVDNFNIFKFIKLSKPATFFTLFPSFPVNVNSVTFAISGYSMFIIYGTVPVILLSCLIKSSYTLSLK